jgi:hypothetical protein
MAKRPAIVFSQNRSGRKTTVRVAGDGVSTHRVKHFDVENGVLSFETEDGERICTNMPFFLKEEAVGKKV